MPDMIANGAEWLTSQREAHLSRDVAYTRAGGGVSLTRKASIGRTEWETTDSSGVQTRTESRDFIFATSSITFTPTRGDRIRETVGAEVLVYEVMAPGEEPVFKPGDAFRSSIRIHTKLVGKEAA